MLKIIKFCALYNSVTNLLLRCCIMRLVLVLKMELLNDA